MTVSVLHHVDFLRRIGHTVRESGGMYWFNCGPRVYASVPYHQSIDAFDVDLDEVLQRDGLIARFGCPIQQGVSSFRIVCDDPNYDFPLLRGRTRTQVRRGLESCRVEQVDFSLLRQKAMPLNSDTLVRQGRSVPENLESYWTRYYEQAASTTGAEAWAAFVGTDLAAYLISFTIDDVANLLIVRSAQRFLEHYPNNALIFTFLQQRLRRGDLRMVSYGYESIQSDLGSLDQFKLGMGFRKDAVGQRVALSKWLRPMVNGLTTRVAGAAVRAFSSGESRAKWQGLLNWYQQQPLLSTTSLRPPESPTAKARFESRGT